MANEYARAISTMDPVRVRDAVDFFHDVHGTRFLIDVLSKSEHSIDLKLYIVHSLDDLVSRGDRSMVPALIAALYAATIPTSGGGDVQIPRGKYRFAIAELLEKAVAHPLIEKAIADTRAAEYGSNLPLASQTGIWKQTLSEPASAEVIRSAKRIISDQAR